MNICRVCDAPMRPDGQFCTLGHEKELGDWIEEFLAANPPPAETVPPKGLDQTICHACSQTVSVDDRFCSSCGERLATPQDAYAAVVGGADSLEPPPPLRALVPPNPTPSGVRVRLSYSNVRGSVQIDPDDESQTAASPISSSRRRR